MPLTAEQKAAKRKAALAKLKARKAEAPASAPSATSPKHNAPLPTVGSARTTDLTSRMSGLGIITQTRTTINKRIIMCSEAKPKSGKSRLGLTMPGPIGVIDMELGMEGVIEPFVAAGKIIHVREFTAVAEAIATGRQLSADDADREWKQFRTVYGAFLEAPESQCRSILIDTGGELYELLRWARFGKLEQVPSHFYGPVNLEMGKLITYAHMYKKNVLFTHRRKKEHRNNEWSGGYEIKGWPDMPHLAQVSILQQRDAATKKTGNKPNFKITITDSRIRASDTIGLTLTSHEGNASFPYLAATVFDDDVEDWMDEATERVLEGAGGDGGGEDESEGEGDSDE